MSLNGRIFHIYLFFFTGFIVFNLLFTNNWYCDNMARIKKATSYTEKPLDVNTTRLPLALKPSNTTTSSPSSSSNQEMSSKTDKIETISELSPTGQPSSSLSFSKETKLSSTGTSRKTTSTMKVTKSKSKAQIIKSQLDEDTDIESDTEGQYDLTTSIEESGGIEQFLQTPCMVLYKRNLTNQG